LQLTGHEVTAVGSRSPTGAERFARQFGIPHAHGSYEALVADPEVDIVYVATPHPMHAANALLALNAGKHVLVEKAFTVNAREARQIVDLATEKRLVVMEAMWTRFLPHMVRIRDIVASGVLGEAWANADLPVTGFGGGSGSADFFGWSVGGGAEVAFSPNWSARFDYQFTDFNSETINYPTGPLEFD